MPTRKRFTEDSYRREPWFKALCHALLSCKTEEDMGSFLRDVGTLSELQAWGERLEVARQLARGLSYREVARQTGASTTTITRVAKFIENGPGGYRKVLRVHRHHRIHPRRAEDVSEHRQQAPDASVHESNLLEITPKDSVLQKYLRRQ